MVQGQRDIMTVEGTSMAGVHRKTWNMALWNATGMC